MPMLTSRKGQPALQKGSKPIGNIDFTLKFYFFGKTLILKSDSLEHIFQEVWAG